MVRILIINELPQSPCSFYRSVEPLARLSKENDIHVTVCTKKCSWENLTLNDILLFQRPFSREDLDIIVKAKVLGLSVWADYDDNLFSVGEYDEAFSYFTDKNNLIELLEMVDIVTVTTEKMKDTYLPYNESTIVIPNCLNDYVFPLQSKKHFSGNKETFWRGSVHKFYDIFYYYPFILKYIQMYDKWKFNFMGYKFKFQTFYDLSLDIKNTEYIKTSEMLTYFWKQHSINAALAIIPLIKNLGNESKSNISWIEATYSGSACLIPSWGDFVNCPGIKYDTQEDFDIQLDRCLSFSADLRRSNEDSWKYI